MRMEQAFATILLSTLGKTIHYGERESNPPYYLKPPVCGVSDDSTHAPAVSNYYGRIGWYVTCSWCWLTMESV